VDIDVFKSQPMQIAKRYPKIFPAQPIAKTKKVPHHLKASGQLPAVLTTGYTNGIS
jgi:hypothetical protein